MTSTRAYRLARIANDLELLASASRRRITMALRDEALAAAASESAALLALFRTEPAQAWARLAALSRPQLVIAAIDMASYLLEIEGRDLPWGIVLERWETKLSEIAEATAAEAEALAAQVTAANVFEAACAESYEAIQATRPAFDAATDAYFAARAAREAAERERFPQIAPRHAP
jgi:hypothetical protein